MKTLLGHNPLGHSFLPYMCALLALCTCVPNGVIFLTISELIAVLKYNAVLEIKLKVKMAFKFRETLITAFELMPAICITWVNPDNSTHKLHIQKGDFDTRIMSHEWLHSPSSKGGL